MSRTDDASPSQRTGSGQGSPADIDRGVVARAARGDGDAAHHVVSVAHQLVIAYCRARLGSVTAGGESAEDLAQEVCLRVLQALPHYQERGRPFLAFVYTIAANAVTDVRRGAARRPAEPLGDRHDVQDPSAHPEEDALRRELGTALRVLLHRLPARAREVLVLRVALGMSTARTSDLLGISPAAVRVAQHRGLQRLRAELMSGARADPRVA